MTITGEQANTVAPVAVGQGCDPWMQRLARIVVPVDGSPAAERALPVATWLAGETGAPIHLLQVVAHPSGAPGAIHALGDLARRCVAPTWEVGVDDDPVSVIAAAVGTDAPGVVCMATHGRDRSAAVLGSVAHAVIDRATGPVMLVGPEARPTSADDAPVVAAVDGAADDDVRVVQVAAAWAARLGRPLVVATVAETAPPPYRPGRPRTGAQAGEDPAAVLARLVQVAGVSDLADTRVVDDPASVRDGLLRLVDRTTALLVMGSHRRVRPLRAVLGRESARVVRGCEVPVLVVPLPAGS
jgi:nucleotide-binding universal stress UspA family protein